MVPLPWGFWGSSCVYLGAIKGRSCACRNEWEPELHSLAPLHAGKEMGASPKASELLGWIPPALGSWGEILQIPALLCAPSALRAALPLLSQSQVLEKYLKLNFFVFIQPALP